MNSPRTLLVAVLLGASLVHPAAAHSWYPMECCSNHDCMSADGLETDRHGDRIVIAGQRRIWVSRGFAVRPSQDDRIHICFRADEFDFKVICLFLPAQS